VKKICHVVDRLNIGGLEKTLVAIALGLGEYEHHVWCLDTNGPLGSVLQSRNVEVRKFGLKGPISFSSIRLLAEGMSKERFDIVHSHGLYPSIWARLSAMAAHVPVKIDHVQNTYAQVPFTDKLKLLALSYSTTKFVAVAEAVKRGVMENIKISASKIEVIYNSSIDMKAESSGARKIFREELGLGKSFVVMSIGRLEKLKGHSFLIDAVKSCRDDDIDVKCVIAGSGPESDELKKKIAGLGLEEAVFLLGARSDIATVLSGADAFIQPSTLIEGLPLVLAEGASMGLPLIATSVGGNAEIVEDGKNGFIVHPKDPEAIADKIVFLARHPFEFKEMGEASRKIWQDKFTRERMLQKIRGLYDGCMRKWDVVMAER